MARRSRRLRPPWIPGFWPLVAALLLAGSLVGYFWALASWTRFERVPVPVPEAKPAAKQAR